MVRGAHRPVTRLVDDRAVITAVPASVLSPDAAELFVDSVADAVVALGSRAGFVDLTRARIVAAQHPDAPRALWFLRDAEGPAGWVGWASPSGAPDAVWESTTFLAPRHRGGDTFAWAKCLQTHAAVALARRWPAATFVSAVAHFNARSLAATRGWFERNGWPADEAVVHSETKGRLEHRFTWPQPRFSALEHRCFTHDAARTWGADGVAAAS